ncbi:MAG: hypothetical protein V4671_01210 [Armatimonadota bacterium]
MKLNLTPLVPLLVLASCASVCNAQTAVPPPLMVPETQLNDIMDGKMPRIPSFPKIARKPGFLRGYVKGIDGKPLVGASIMILPPTVYGSGLSKRSVIAKTDANGLYEVAVPSGGCTVWCAGHAVNYRGVRLALPLHPVDGNLDSINTKGDIENFALLPYGVANVSTSSENPGYGGAYYGASFTVNFASREPEDTNYPQWLPFGSEIEITLVPDGLQLDGSVGRPIIIRKKVSPKGWFQVNNVPIGQYKIRARLTEDGKTVPLVLKDNSNRDRKGGMTPPESSDWAAILFRSGGGDPVTQRVPGGGMDRHGLIVERPK